MDTGYIKIHRKFLNWYGFSSSKRVHLWITLLLKANHKEHRFIFNGEPIIVERGSFVSGTRKLFIETGISYSYIHKLLKEFETDGMLKQQISARSRLITILCYNQYQGDETQKEHKKNAERTQKEPNKNEKNEKNEKKVSNTDFIQSIKDNIAYSHIAIDVELAKMDAWLGMNPGRVKDKRFVINWLNKIDVPIAPEDKKVRYRA